MVFNICIIASILLFFIIESYLKKQSEALSKRECIIAFFLYVGYAFIILKVLGVVDSGYHFVDDHVFLAYRNMIEDVGILQTIKYQLSVDLIERFRFVYIILRVFHSLLWPHFVLFYLGQSILVGFGMYLSYIVARKYSCPKWLSYLFSVIILIGPQSEVVWRLGTQEMTCIVFLMATLVLIFNYVDNPKNIKNLMWVILIMPFLAGTKESFLVLLPALAMILVLRVFQNRELPVTFSNVISVVREYIVGILWIMVVFFADIYFILTHIDVNGFGYAGVDTSVGLSNYLSVFKEIAKDEFEFFVPATLIVIGVLFVISLYQILVNKNYEGLKLLFIEVCIFGVMLLPQLVLHAKSRMYKRYLIPSTVAFAFVLVIFAYIHLKDLKRIKVLYYIFILAVTAQIMLDSPVWARGTLFASDGVNAGKIMKNIAADSQGEKTVVSVMDMELDLSIAMYLQDMYGERKVYNVYRTDIVDGKVFDFYNDDRASINFNEADMYVTKLESEEWIQLANEYSIDLDDFEYKEYGRYVLYIRK